MDWMSAIDGYCERTDASYWSEPLNAVSNAGFLLAAALCWRMTGRDPGARLLVVILAAIGVGSFLFHTHARTWAMLADVLPIQAFILVYIYLATVRFFAAPRWAGLAAAAAFVPVGGAVGAAIARLFGPLNGSVGYMPVVLLIAAYAAGARPPRPGDGAGHGGRGRPARGVALLPHDRRRRLRRVARRNAFPLAPAERDAARLDDPAAGAPPGQGSELM